MTCIFTDKELLNHVRKPKSNMLFYSQLTFIREASCVEQP